MNTLTSMPTAVEPQIETILTDVEPALSADVPWGERQQAARRLGRLGGTSAVNALIAALPHDPFWIVRCSIILALQQIGDPAAIPALEAVAHTDSFQAVRSHARKAVERLSS